MGQLQKFNTENEDLNVDFIIFVFEISNFIAYGINPPSLMKSFSLLLLAVNFIVKNEKLFFVCNKDKKNFKSQSGITPFESE